MQSCIKTAAKRRLQMSPFFMARKPIYNITRRRLSGSALKNCIAPKTTEELKLTQGSIYYHNELGYRGVIMYDFESDSTFLDSEHKVDKKSENMYLGVLLSDPLEATRSKVEKHLTTIMVDNDGRSTGFENSSTPTIDHNIVKAPLPGLDVVNQCDIVPISEPNLEFELSEARVPYLQLFFEGASENQLLPREKIIAKWRESYNIHENSYCLRHNFADEGLMVEFYQYPYDPFTRCSDRSNHKNNAFRYRVNVSRTMYHDPVALTHRRRSAQFSSDIFVNKKWAKIELTPMLVCKHLGPSEPNNQNNDQVNAASTDQTRTFQFPAFELVQEP